MHTYEDLWSKQGTRQSSSTAYVEGTSSRTLPIDDIPESRRFHILLNAIFALGSHGKSSETPQMQQGDLFWSRCKELFELDFDMLNRPRLLLVQAILYMAIYLQSTTELTGACWSLVGIAIRMSQAMGLHSGHTFKLERGQNCHIEPRLLIRWKTWAGCILMDR